MPKKTEWEFKCAQGQGRLIISGDTSNTEIMSDKSIREVVADAEQVMESCHNESAVSVCPGGCDINFYHQRANATLNSREKTSVSSTASLRTTIE